MMEGGKIVKLPQHVIDKIAAGEVVQRPMNAVKELMENSLDAGATQIIITIKGGGLKMIQIHDNGHGIKKDDLAIVCDRFTTSKLREFEDLQTIESYGFRGEALAAVSQMSFLTITSKTANDVCAYKALYREGHLFGDIRSCAGSQGTIILAEDLFYNQPIRRNALKSASDEYSKIHDVVTKYSIHNSRVSFVLKKDDERNVQVRTARDSTPEQNIAILHGAQLAKELVSLSHQNDRLIYRVSNALISNVNFSLKKFTFILFVNNRLVECSPLKRALELIYSAFLPKGTYPFVYLDIRIPPERIDVNVHPSKQQVHFLNETEIIEEIQQLIESKLRDVTKSRVFYVQQMPATPSPAPKMKSTDLGNDQNVKITPSSSANKEKVYDYQLVRTDNRERKLEEFFTFSPQQGGSSSTANHARDTLKRKHSEPATSSHSHCPQQQPQCSNHQAPNSEIALALTPTNAPPKTIHHHHQDQPGPICSDDPSVIQAIFDQPSQEQIEVEKREFNFSSLRFLRKQVCQEFDREFRQLFENHKFVGCVDERRVLIQSEISLYLIDIEKICREFFYQVALFRFGNYKSFVLDQPAAAFDLISLGYKYCSTENFTNNIPPQETSNDTHLRPASERLKDRIRQGAQLLISKSDMLHDYFALEIKDGCLLSVPALISDYTPQLEGLPSLFYTLATGVNWEDEKGCFQGVLRALAEFYTLKSVYCQGEFVTLIGAKNTGDQEDPRVTWKWLIEHVLCPALKTKFVPSKSLAQTGAIIKLTDLNEIYKVFERC